MALKMPGPEGRAGSNPAARTSQTSMQAARILFRKQAQATKA